LFLFSDFNQDGKPDNISFMIKRVKVHSNPDPTYKFLGNYGVEKFLEIFSGKSKSTKYRHTQSSYSVNFILFGKENILPGYKMILLLNWYFYALKGQHKRPFNTTGAIFYAFIFTSKLMGFCFLFYLFFSFKIPFITAASKSTTNVT